MSALAATLVILAGIGAVASIHGLFAIRKWQREYQQAVELDRARRHQFERSMGRS